MAEGNSTFMGLAMPLNGESEITQTTIGNDIVTITGVASQTGDFLVCQNSSGTETHVIDVDGNVTIASKINKMVITTVALAALASNGTASVTLAGITTDCVAMIFPRAASTTDHQPIVWPNSAGKLSYGAASAATTDATVNIWFFDTK
jgi:hypothetical protein